MKISRILLLLFSFCILTSKALLEEEKSYNGKPITIDDINQPFSEENCTIAIENLIRLFKEGYIYTDIKKNPPNVDYYGAVDIIDELNKTSVKDRKYYDFFRDIKRILGKIKDGHLNIAAYQSPNGYYIQKIAVCLPFMFGIDGNNREDSKIYITKFDDCFDFFDEDVKKFVKEHENAILSKINDEDPFDYIQNINAEFDAFYNKHSTFTRNMKSAHKINIFSNPLSKDQLSNLTFYFDDGTNITLSYYLYYDEEDFENQEFTDFYNKERLRELKSMDDVSILDIKHKFNKMKNNIKEEKSNIDWDYSTQDGLIKCRVDKKNNLNVFTQNTFHYVGPDYKGAVDIVEKCTELFYSNKYPIVGIESYNGGGTCKLSYYFQTLLQTRILPSPHYSTLKSKLMKEYVEADIPDIKDDPDMCQRIDIQTCQPFAKFDDMKEIEDDYGAGVKHNRTQYFRVFNSSDLKEHKKVREKYFKLDNLKRPTDIIIFTDTYSFSATSFFIKGLQETGAAILVGYFGNPKSDEVMDASQSPSFVGYFPNTDVYKNLKEVGILIRGVTIYESYNYTYQIKNPYPREYLIHPVDEKFDMFKPYSDDLYDQFIEKAKDVLKKYNDDKQCNPKNLELVYDPNNKKDCYTFEGDEHAHGGYECDATKGTWSKTCKPYYCDIGYYFDKYTNKCIKDICTEEDIGPTDSDHGEGDIISLNKYKMFLALLAILL